MHQLRKRSILSERSSHRLVVYDTSHLVVVKLECIETSHRATNAYVNYNYIVISKLMQIIPWKKQLNILII